MIHKYHTIEDTVYFWFASNVYSTGSGGDGSNPVYDVRLAGDTAGAAPILSGSAVLLSHADYPDGCHEIAIAATAANGFSANNEYAVFFTLLISAQNPTGYAGSFSLKPVISNNVMFDSTQLVDDIWDELLTGSSHNIATSAGRRLRDIASNVIITGTSPGTGNTSIRIELDGDASSTNGSYDPAIIIISDGTGAGQSRQIFEYDGDNKYAYINRDWKTIPDATSKYVIIGHSGDTHVNEGLATGGGETTITLNDLASSVNNTYIGQTVFLCAGTGQDQSRHVTAYDGTTKIATVDRAWNTNPVGNATVYAILPNTDIESIINDIDEIKGTGFVKDTHSLTDIITGNTAIKAKTDNLPSGVAKNVVLANFPFMMVDNTDHVTPKTLLTVTATISKDGGAFASCTNSVTEISNGMYKISLTQPEMNADVIVLKFTATGADQRTIVITTS